MQNNNNSLAYAPNLDIIQMDETLKQTLQNKKALPLLKRRLKQLQLLKDKSVSPAVLIVAARNIEIEITEIGTYWVSVTSEFGCVTSSTFNVIESGFIHGSTT